jgi:signal transduction histidine kinase
VKLLSKTHLYYHITALFVVLAGTGIFFVMLEKIVHDETNEQLSQEQKQVLALLHESSKVPEHFVAIGDRVDISSVTSPLTLKPRFGDTTLYSSEEKEELPYRKLTFAYQQGDSWYRITISRALFESDDLLTTIVKAMLIIMLVLLIAILLINRWISKRMWAPFYLILEKLKQLNLTGGSAFTPDPSGIDEFDALNTSIEKMSEKMVRDYVNLKSFSENASHEIQTPLAIITSKLELLIQSKGLDEQQSKLISDAYEGATRLSKLNQALILLTRIGNEQFPETKTIHLGELLVSKLGQFEDLISHKKIAVTTQLKEAPVWNMNPVLADILVSNILGNAIRHNLPGGKLDIQTATESIRISNTGQHLQTEPGELFQRFRKGNASGESLGLGLAIVKQICESYSISIAYTYSDSQHTLILNSPSKSN